VAGPPAAPPTRSTRGSRGGVLLFLLLLGGLLLSISGCRALTSRSQLARALLWRDADVDDIRRFPARPVPAGERTRPWIEGSLEGYDSLTAPFRVGEAGEAVPFEDFFARRATTAFLIVRGDTLLYEKYFGEFEGDSLHTVFSVSKSVLSAAVGAAVERGMIESVDDPITRYVPELLERDSRFGRITLRHLLTMSSGLAWDDSMTPWGDPADTYYAPDLRESALEARVAGPPGEEFVYNNYNPLLVGLALERAADTTVSAFLSGTVWGPMGAEADASWSLDRAEGGFEKMESGFNARPRDLARFGAMFRDGGVSGGRRVLPASWGERSVRPDSTTDPNPDYQYFWWVRPGADGDSHFWAEGRFGQFVYVVPHLDLVVVRLGRDDGDLDWRSFFAAVVRRVEAVDAGSR